MIQKDEVVWEGNERCRGETKVNGSGVILDQSGDKETDYTQTSTASRSNWLGLVRVPVQDLWGDKKS